MMWRKMILLAVILQSSICTDEENNERGNSAGTPDECKKCNCIFLITKNESLELPKFEFWNKQLVPKIDEKMAVGTNEPVAPEDDERWAKIQSEIPTPLPEGLEWCTLDLTDTPTLVKVQAFLSENYVEDENEIFRIGYSLDFMEWALKPPGWQPEFHIGLLETQTRKLVGFVSAVPATINISGVQLRVTETDFLCVDKAYRNQRLTPQICLEMLRRVSLKKIFHSIYTAVTLLPKPLVAVQIFHRIINVPKVIKSKFADVIRGWSVEQMIHYYALPEKVEIPNFRELKEEDVPEACALLTNYLQRFQLVPVFTLEEFWHWFQPRKDIMSSFVVYGEDGKITDFISYYTNYYTAINNPLCSEVKIASSYYYASTKTPLKDLWQAALIKANNDGHDVFTSGNIMDNFSFLKELKFWYGTGVLNYYMYNWKHSELKAADVGLVLL